VAERLRADGHSEVAFVGTPDGQEARLVTEAGLEFHGIPSKGFDRSRPLSLVVAAAVLAISTLKAVMLLRRLRPDVVAGFGGYVSMPVGIAARLLGVRLVLQEQNSVPGLANRFLSRWAREVGVTYEQSAAYLRHPDRVVLTGNPVRPAFLEADRLTGRQALGVPGDAVVLLVFGGSRGARHINQAVVAGLASLLAVPDSFVVHVAGREEAEEVRSSVAVLSVDHERYRIYDYIEDMGAALAACDLVVARAGATSIAEITAVGRASVLVPYPYATDDHQTKNAQALSAAGGALVFSDDALDRPEFIEAVTALLSDAGRRATMAAASRSLGRSDAAERVARMIRAETVSREHEPAKER